MITCNFSLSGIKELYICYETSSYHQPIAYPIMPIINTVNNKVKCSQNKPNKTISIGSGTYNYIDLTGNFQSFTEELVEDDKGRYYISTLNLSSVFDINMVELLNQKHVTVFIVDNNNNQWVIGYKMPMKLINYNYSSGVDNDGGDKYDLVYTNTSYTKIKNYELV